MKYAVEAGQKAPFQQRDGGFASFRSRGTLGAHLFGVGDTTSLPLNDAKTVKMARPPHNSDFKQKRQEPRPGLENRRNMPELSVELKTV